LNKYSKRAIPILIIAVLILTLLPVIPVSAITASHAPGSGIYGDEITVSGSGVTAGATVNIYWDLVQSWNGSMGLIKTGTALPAGTYSIDFEIPEAVNGVHYIWVKDTETGETANSGPITVNAAIELDPERGLEKDTVDITGYGFAKEEDIDMVIFDFGGADEVVESTSPATPETDEVGSWTASIAINDKTPDWTYGAYTVFANDTTAISATATFTIGASITLDKDDGPSGTIVRINGRGFMDATLQDITLGGPGSGNYTLPTKTDTIGDISVSGGKFTADVVILNMSSTGDYWINCSDTMVWANEDFELTGNPYIEIDPGYGAPLESISISGGNFTQIAGKDVELVLGGTPVGTLTTLSDGSFSGTFSVPAIAYGVHEMLANDSYTVMGTKNFRVGVMVVVPVPTSGPSGKYTTLTGTGFEIGGPYNFTIGDLDTVYEGTADGSGVISHVFYAPTLDPGTYTINVMDINTEIEIQSTWTCTHRTMLTADPVEGPNKYNVTLEGNYFAQDAANTLDEGWLYNSTYELDLTTLGVLEFSADFNSTGFFEGWLVIPDEDDLGLGDYTLNISDTNGMWVEIPFSVVEERIAISTRQTEYAVGDTLFFVIKNDFFYADSYVKIWDPDGELYWMTDLFGAADWLKVEGVYTVPFYSQTAGGNPLTFTSASPLGTWTWTFYKDGDTELASDQFTLGKSVSSVLQGQMESLTDDFATLEGTVGTLSDNVDAISGQVGTLSQQVSAAVDAANQAVNAANAASNAVQDLTDTVSDIAQTANSAKTAADSAKSSADAAKTAAEDAKTASGGLTTLVYGAIGASLIAALAAIVSLMQISRRIAG
jgi:uncharacterized protein YoxC